MDPLLISSCRQSVTVTSSLGQHRWPKPMACHSPPRRPQPRARRETEEEMRENISDQEFFFFFFLSFTHSVFLNDWTAFFLLFLFSVCGLCLCIYKYYFFYLFNSNDGFISFLKLLYQSVLFFHYSIFQQLMIALFQYFLRLFWVFNNMQKVTHLFILISFRELSYFLAFFIYIFFTYLVALYF